MRLDESRLEQRMALLRSTTMLAGLEESNLVRLMNASKLINVPKGIFLFYENDPANAFYILRSGEMSIILSSVDGREMIIDEVRPGDCFGEVGLLTNGKRTAGAQARENCTVLEIPAKTFLGVLDVEPALSRRLLELATHRLFKAQKRESALAFLDAPARVARVLLQLDEIDKQGPDKGYITLSQEEVAQRTGLTRQTVANSLAQWRKQEWIITGRGRIMILNRAALRRIREQKLS